jgi:hypothetical protein
MMRNALDCQQDPPQQLRVEEQAMFAAEVVLQRRTRQISLQRLKIDPTPADTCRPRRNFCLTGVVPRHETHLLGKYALYIARARW